MQNDWILDVLADLKTFAMANDLRVLAEQLEDTTLVAASEIASKAEEAPAHINGEQGQSGSVSRRTGSH